jgi:hypothetical protein
MRTSYRFRARLANERMPSASQRRQSIDRKRDARIVRVFARFAKPGFVRVVLTNMLPTAMT